MGGKQTGWFENRVQRVIFGCKRKEQQDNVENSVVRKVMICSLIQ
jgi:hypothetical protein